MKKIIKIAIAAILITLFFVEESKINVEENNIVIKNKIALAQSSSLEPTIEVGPICMNNRTSICWRFPDMNIYGKFV
ncbi:MAG TPA: hypothetical protein P5132_02485 [Bacteroidales bacterium]|nr:hypothetical protein [Bacteroidales bacterium]